MSIGKIIDKNNDQKKKMEKIKNMLVNVSSTGVLDSKTFDKDNHLDKDIGLSSSNGIMLYLMKLAMKNTSIASNGQSLKHNKSQSYGYLNDKNINNLANLFMYSDNLNLKKVYNGLEDINKNSDKIQDIKILIDSILCNENIFKWWCTLNPNDVMIMAKNQFFWSSINSLKKGLIKN